MIYLIETDSTEEDAETDVTRTRMYIVQSIVYGFKEITPGVIFITNFHGWRDIFASINFDFMLC